MQSISESCIIKVHQRGENNFISIIAINHLEIVFHFQTHKNTHESLSRQALFEIGVFFFILSAPDV